MFAWICSSISIIRAAIRPVFSALPQRLLPAPEVVPGAVSFIVHTVCGARWRALSTRKDMMGAGGRTPPLGLQVPGHQSVQSLGAYVRWPTDGASQFAVTAGHRDVLGTRACGITCKGTSGKLKPPRTWLVSLASARGRCALIASPVRTEDPEHPPGSYTTNFAWTLHSHYRMKHVNGWVDSERIYWITDVWLAKFYHMKSSAKQMELHTLPKCKY